MTLSVVCLAGHGEAPPRLNGQDFLDYYLGAPGVPKAEQGARALVRWRYAAGYLDGVADTSRGRAWCATGTVKTIEIDAYVVDEMRTLPAAVLAGDAAPLMIGLLHKKFPCSRRTS
ncbi:MAG TPA: hypothetical protein DCW29_08000 [Janthinobacterium sp.]|nr:hypothetical protein [Janthinobacterium sp.]